MKVPVRLIQGSMVAISPEEQEMGRGVGSYFAAANVTRNDKYVVASMEIPEQFRHFSDEELVKAFVAGFNGANR